jgi:hypothetical protein
MQRDFAEFGRSGRRYTRAEILDLDVGEIHATLPLRDLRCRRLGGGVVLVTYQADAMVSCPTAARSGGSPTPAGRWRSTRAHRHRPADTATHPRSLPGMPGGQMLRPALTDDVTWVECHDHDTPRRVNPSAPRAARRPRLATRLETPPHRPLVSRRGRTGPHRGRRHLARCRGS